MDERTATCFGARKKLMSLIGLNHFDLRINLIYPTVLFHLILSNYQHLQMVRVGYLLDFQLAVPKALAVPMHYLKFLKVLLQQYIIFVSLILEWVVVLNYLF